MGIILTVLIGFVIFTGLFIFSGTPFDPGPKDPKKKVKKPTLVYVLTDVATNKYVGVYGNMFEANRIMRLLITGGERRIEVSAVTVFPAPCKEE